VEIGIGLPGHVPGGLDGTTVTEWAARAENRGFSTLAVSDRIAWTSPEPLILLAAAAGVTSRIRLATTVLIAPLRTNHSLFAKQIATLDRIAGPDRVRLGVAPGVREDDFELSGVDFGARGEEFDALLARLDEVWSANGPIGPRPATTGGPNLMFGGMSAATLRRITRLGGGWVIGDCTVDEFSEFADRARKAWSDAGREGSLHTTVSLMYALGPDATTAVRDAIGPYYAFIGDEWVEYSINAAYTDPEQIRRAVDEFGRAGCDELIFTGNSTDPGQVDLLAEALGMR
jgi:alkanesulfonate monooxygenase SsuD/methylene tetrahydromethanopterin reductase-like flavin-dependent oxidoreductase (luciferase family)